MLDVMSIGALLKKKWRGNSWVNCSAEGKKESARKLTKRSIKNGPEEKLQQQVA